MGKVPLIDFESLRAPVGEAPEITVTVTEPATSGCDTPPKWSAYDPIWDQCEIPDFLKRNPDNTWAHPTTPASDTPPLKTTAPAGDASEPDGSSPEIASALPPPLSAEDMRKHVNDMKKKASLAKLRLRTAEEAARNEGKVWRNGRFVHHDSLTKGEYARIMGELPTMNMKRLFAHLYSEKVE